MIIVRATKDTEAGVPPDEKVVAAMVTYHEELVKAGVLLDANGLHASSQGFRVRWHAGRQTLVDGPFAETKELIAGCTVIQVKSPDEAREWAKRCPAPFGERRDGEIEVRRVYELDEIGPAELLGSFREMAMSTRK
jgi:hypothetical protein